MKERILIIADDFTGMLDTAIQFVKWGGETAAHLSADAFLSRPSWGPEPVQAVNTGSRHLPPEQAGQLVANIAREGLRRGATIVYKKTDSALRGNIGAELDAVLQEAGGPLLYAPAYPENGRTTENGIQLLNGIPISETEYGQDPFTPVSLSDIPELLRKQSQYPPVLLPAGTPLGDWQRRKIYVADAATAEQMDTAASAALTLPIPRALGGSAGLARGLAKALYAPEVPGNAQPEIQKLLVVSGSLNQSTVRQLRQVSGETGVPVIPIEKPALKALLQEPEGYRNQLCQWQQQLCQHSCLILEAVRNQSPVSSLDREDMARMLGMLTRDLLENTENCDLFVVGGDTLEAVAGAAFSGVLYPRQELAVGIPLSVGLDNHGRRIQVISKSGAFGQEDFIKNTVQQILRRNTL